MTETNDGPERTLVNFQVSPDQKAKWDEYVEESDEHPSLSQLLRAAVEREIAGTQSGGGGTSDEAMEAITEVASRTRQMDSRLDNVTEELSAIKDALSEPDDDLKDLMGSVFDVLPTEDEVNHPNLTIDGDVPDTVVDQRNNGTRYVWTGTVGDIAEHLDAQRYRVGQALEQLQQDTSMVESVVIEGEERYVRGS